MNWKALKPAITKFRGLRIDLLSNIFLIISLFIAVEVNCQETELAGNSLSEYPYFEYVKAFNENVNIKVAIDPTRYPSIIGEVADVYVVEAKDAASWQNEPLLIDVTPGGALTETFSGTTIQENTFTVADQTI